MLLLDDRAVRWELVGGLREQVDVDQILVEPLLERLARAPVRP